MKSKIKQLEIPTCNLTSFPYCYETAFISSNHAHVSVFLNSEKVIMPDLLVVFEFMHWSAKVIL